MLYSFQVLHRFVVGIHRHICVTVATEKFVFHILKTRKLFNVVRHSVFSSEEAWGIFDVTLQRRLVRGFDVCKKQFIEFFCAIKQKVYCVLAGDYSLHKHCYILSTQLIGAIAETFRQT